MSAIIAIILPVFLVILMGYLFRWRKLISDGGVDGLMKFTQGFAIPCLLFRSISHLDLSASFEPALMISFYTGALSGFAIGMLGARYFFGRDWEDSVAIGFLGLFSNSLLLGLP
ncbi:MAG: AEC family transporter, partial [Rhodobacteraceae bacterium]|nr:AEC family transporter [Paracoccaceae bacterium]